MIGKTKEEGRVCTVLLHVSSKSPTPSANRLTAILNWKSFSPSRVSNPAWPDRTLSLLLVLPPFPYCIKNLMFQVCLTEDEMSTSVLSFVQMSQRRVTRVENCPRRDFFSLQTTPTAAVLHSLDTTFVLDFGLQWRMFHPLVKIS